MRTAARSASRIRRPLAVLALSAALAGCGASTRAPGDAAASRLAFSSALDGICRSSTLATVALGRARSVAQLAQVLARALPIARREYGQLRRLGPPSIYRHAYRNFVWISGRELRLTVAMLDAARADDLMRLRSIIVQANGYNPASDLDSRLMHVNWCLSTVTGTTTTTTPLPSSTIAS